MASQSLPPFIPVYVKPKIRDWILADFEAVGRIPQPDGITSSHPIIESILKKGTFPAKGSMGKERYSACEVEFIDAARASIAQWDHAQIAVYVGRTNLAIRVSTCKRKPPDERRPSPKKKRGNGKNSKRSNQGTAEQSVPPKPDDSQDEEEETPPTSDPDDELPTEPMDWEDAKQYARRHGQNTGAFRSWDNSSSESLAETEP